MRCTCVVCGKMYTPSETVTYRGICTTKCEKSLRIALGLPCGQKFERLDVGEQLGVMKKLNDELKERRLTDPSADKTGLKAAIALKRSN